MFFNEEQTNQLNVLTQFNLKNEMDGIKIHHDAAASLIDAAKELHRKGLITEEDGGYLTDLGRKAADHADALRFLLK